MKDIAESVFILGFIIFIVLLIEYTSDKKFQRCIYYGADPTYSSMFGNSCKDFYK